MRDAASASRVCMSPFPHALRSPLSCLTARVALLAGPVCSSTHCSPTARSNSGNNSTRSVCAGGNRDRIDARRFESTAQGDSLGFFCLLAFFVFFLLSVSLFCLLLFSSFRVLPNIAAARQLAQLKHPPTGAEPHHSDAFPFLSQPSAPAPSAPWCSFHFPLLFCRLALVLLRSVLLQRCLSQSYGFWMSFSDCCPSASAFGRAGTGTRPRGSARPSTTRPSW